MVESVEVLRLAGYAVGAFGAMCLFVEFFQQPSYVSYEPEFDSYSVEMSPLEVREHTWIGRAGALFVGLAFALQFLAAFLG